MPRDNCPGMRHGKKAGRVLYAASFKLSKVREHMSAAVRQAEENAESTAAVWENFIDSILGIL